MGAKEEEQRHEQRKKRGRGARRRRKRAAKEDDCGGDRATGNGGSDGVGEGRWVEFFLNWRGEIGDSGCLIWCLGQENEAGDHCGEQTG